MWGGGGLGLRDSLIDLAAICRTKAKQRRDGDEKIQ